MSFLKISDPLKRDAIVKEYLELKKKIKSNFLSERIGEQQLQTDLSKFYKPITETPKATAREITEGLKPIREGIEKLPEAITFPPTQPLGKATEEEEEEEEEEKEIGEIAEIFLNRTKPDTNFGIREEKGHHYIGNQHVIVYNNDIILPKFDKRFKGTVGLWTLITSKNPKNFTDEDYANYRYLLLKTNAIHLDDNPYNRRAKGNYRGDKWENIIRPIWKEIMKKMDEKEYEGEGVVVIPSDPNALLERLDLLLASQKAGHTGVRNELVSICDELKRQGVLDTNGYKNLNHLIKK